MVISSGVVTTMIWKLDFYFSTLNPDLSKDIQCALRISNIEVHYNKTVISQGVGYKTTSLKQVLDKYYKN